MKQQLFVWTFLLLFCFKGMAQECQSLNGDWLFRMAKNEKEAERLKDFYRPGANTAGFKTTPVPSNWAVLGYEEPHYGGFEHDIASEGFYLRDFDIPATWDKQRILLHFGGVWSSAEVWLNGKRLGEHMSGYTSFAFDISRVAKAGERNHLAVRVRQVNREYRIDSFDDWTWGGIYRDVTLEKMPADRFIDHVTTITHFDKIYEDADLEVRVHVSDPEQKIPGVKDRGVPYDLRVSLYDPEGKKIDEQTRTIPYHHHTDRVSNLTFHILNAHKWTAETPNLYRLQAELIEQGGEVTHQRQTAVGLREIKTEGGILRVNGQAVKLRGVNRHDEHPDVGRATLREHWIEDITKMKQANINYIRLAHYAHNEGFIALCDSMGMYVGAEVSLGGAWQRAMDPSFNSAFLQRTYETISRDLNHPSILYWSIGNEDGLTPLHMAAIQAARGFDPTRPVMIPWLHYDWLPQEIGLLSIHYWEPENLEQYVGNLRRPVIMTEYAHAFGTDGICSMEDCWKACTQFAQGAGGAIWMWQDQGIKTPVRKDFKDLEPNDEYLRVNEGGWDGIVDSYRNVTPDYWEAQAVYAPVRPTVSQLSFTPGQPTLTLPIQNDYDFTDLSQVRLQWKLYEEGKLLDKGEKEMQGVPHAIQRIQIPIAAVKEIQADKSYYLHLSFFNPAAGTDAIICRSVELLPTTPKEPFYPTRNEIMVEKGEQTVVRVGNVCYTFDGQTGSLSKATLDGQQLITELTPIIWRERGFCEWYMYHRNKFNDSIDLNTYTAKVEDLQLQQAADRCTINTKVRYTVDAKNSFTVAYRYVVHADGELSIRYELLTDVETPKLPIVGLKMKGDDSLTSLHWLGQGPHDAYINRQAAAYFGYWGGAAGSDETVGNKIVRRVDWSNGKQTIQVSGCRYMEHYAAQANEVYLLTEVMARPAKGRPATATLYPTLNTNSKDPFIGELQIRLK